MTELRTLDTSAVAFVEIRHGTSSRRILLRAPTITIGSDPACDVVLADVPNIAPRHARLQLVAGAHHVVAEPGAGVILGDRRVRDAVLHDGDVVMLVADDDTARHDLDAYADADPDAVPEDHPDKPDAPADEQPGAHRDAREREPAGVHARSRVSALRGQPALSEPREPREPRYRGDAHDPRRPHDTRAADLGDTRDADARSGATDVPAAADAAHASEPRTSVANDPRGRRDLDERSDARAQRDLRGAEPPRDARDTYARLHPGEAREPDGRADAGLMDASGDRDAVREQRDPSEAASAPTGTHGRSRSIGTSGGVPRGRSRDVTTEAAEAADAATRLDEPVRLVYHNPLASRIASVQHFATPPGVALLTIGRLGADIVLDQPLVSRRHAELAWVEGHHVLRDCGSANGTWVNGEPLHGARRLAPGDVLQIGTFRLTYDGDSLDSFDQRGAIRIDASNVERRVGGRVLLAPTTLSIEPCEFVAIVGGSGAGKSTLMTALCGFARATSGKVEVNGDDLYAGYDAYRSIIGYVPQDDILHRSLTVERALYHAARLRLPADTTPGELQIRIASVLDAVDMADHVEKRIDQLSGGQRKRVSIACELLADPVLLFLDEPTSGLDPGLERKLMQTLRELADGGRTIVLVTHATTNIKMCDHVAFLSAGRLTYFGPPSQALEFFAVDDFADIYSAIDHPAAAERWEQRYRGSLQHQKYAVERPARAPSAPSVEQRDENARRVRSFAQSRLRQLGILCRRYVELVLADRKNLALLLLQAPVIGLLLVLVSKRDGLTSGRIDAKKLVFMLATTGVWFGVINAAREICKEAHVLRRERLAGLRAGPYLGSKLVVLFGLVLVQTALLLGVIALGIDMPRSGIVLPPTIELFVTIALAGLAGITLGLCVSAVTTTPDKATSLIPIVLVPQVLFAGIMFSLKGVPKLLSHLVSSRAAVDAMSATVDTNALAIPVFVPVPAEPQYAHTSEVLFSAWGSLLAQSVLFMAIAWWMLHRRRDT